MFHLSGFFCISALQATELLKTLGIEVRSVEERLRPTCQKQSDDLPPHPLPPQKKVIRISYIYIYIMHLRPTSFPLFLRRFFPGSMSRHRPSRMQGLARIGLKWP